jgi:hypothetical protein
MPLSDQDFEEFKKQRQVTSGLSDEGFEAFKAEKLKPPPSLGEPFFQLKTLAQQPLVGAFADLLQIGKSALTWEPKPKPQWQAPPDLGFQPAPISTTAVAPKPAYSESIMKPAEKTFYESTTISAVPETPTLQESAENTWNKLQEILQPGQDVTGNVVKGAVRAGLGIPGFFSQLGDVAQKAMEARSPGESAKILGKFGLESAESLARPIENMIYTIGYALSPFGSKTQEAEYKTRLDELAQDLTAPIVSAIILRGLTKAPAEIKKSETFKKTMDVARYIKENVKPSEELPIVTRGVPPIVIEPSIGKLQMAQSDLLQETMRKARGVEILAKEEPSIGKLQTEQTGPLQRIMEEAKQKEVRGMGEPAPTEGVPAGLSDIGFEKFKAEGGIAPVTGTGETKPLGLSKHIMERAIEGGLTEGFEVPTYDVLNIKKQASQVADIVSTNYNKAYRIGMGYEPAPIDIHSSAFVKGIETVALASKDGATIRDLALNSKLMEQAKSAGQWIKSLDGLDYESPVRQVREIAKAKETTARVRIKDFDEVKTKEINNIKTQVKKASLSGQTWEQFIQSIRC